MPALQYDVFEAGSRVQAFLVPIVEVLDRPGTLKDIDISAPLPGVGNPLASVPDENVSVQGRAEGVHEGILVTGQVLAKMEARCARCLDELPGDLEVRVCELFAGPDHLPEKGEDIYEVSGTNIDLEPMVRDALALALPLNPLCSADCKGLCSGCGVNLNITECTCVTDEVDPRWAALDELRAKLEAS